MRSATGQARLREVPYALVDVRANPRHRGCGGGRPRLVGVLVGRTACQAVGTGATEGRGDQGGERRQSIRWKGGGDG
jgi:hypothetical protein